MLAQVKGGKGGDLTLTINSAQRESCGFTTFKGTLKNDGPAVVVLPGWASEETELKDNGLSMAGATMVDKKGKKRYFILRDTNGRCLCTRSPAGSGGRDHGVVRPVPRPARVDDLGRLPGGGPAQRDRRAVR